jgi:uncharacterized RDD family membrane protein YckC
MKRPTKPGYVLAIETPEGVTFSFELATPITRSLAWAVDTAASGAIAYGVARTCEIVGALSTDWANALGVLSFFGISIIYCIVLEWRWSGQTIGTRLLGLRVIDEQGLRLRLPQVFLRNIMRLIDAPPPLLYLIGGIAALVSSKGQRLGDMAANTVVIRERHRQPPNLEQIAPARYNSLLAYPSLAARLRSLASPEAVGMAVRAVSRRDGYEPMARVELFRELAEYFRALVSFPEAALEGLTDEQYLRSVLRVVYGAGSR